MRYKSSQEFYESVGSDSTPGETFVRINEAVRRGQFANAQIIAEVYDKFFMENKKHGIRSNPRQGGHCQFYRNRNTVVIGVGEAALSVIAKVNDFTLRKSNSMELYKEETEVVFVIADSCTEEDRNAAAYEIQSAKKHGILTAGITAAAVQDNALPSSGIYETLDCIISIPSLNDCLLPVEVIADTLKIGRKDDFPQCISILRDCRAARFVHGKAAGALKHAHAAQHIVENASTESKVHVLLYHIHCPAEDTLPEIETGWNIFDEHFTGRWLFPSLFGFNFDEDLYGEVCYSLLLVKPHKKNPTARNIIHMLYRGWMQLAILNAL
jgi:hypothetical protein